MRGDLSVPPRRDLPPGRLAQRREHLLFEITRKRGSREALVSPWPSRSGRPGRRRLLALAAGRARRDRRNRLCDRQRARLHPRSGASSACLPWERRRARRRAGSSSSAGWGGARPTREDAMPRPLSVPGCTPTGESSGLRRARRARGQFPRARTSSPPATSSNDSRPRVSSSCGRRSSDSSNAVTFRLETIPTDDEPRSYPAVDVRDGDRLVRANVVRRLRHRDAGAACGSPTGRRAAHRHGVGAAAERVGRAQDQGVRAVALRSVHRHLAAEGCVSAPVPAAGAGRGRAPRQEPDTARGAT